MKEVMISQKKSSREESFWRRLDGFASESQVSVGQNDAPLVHVLISGTIDILRAVAIADVQ